LAGAARPCARMVRRPALDRRYVLNAPSFISEIPASSGRPRVRPGPWWLHVAWFPLCPARSSVSCFIPSRIELPSLDERPSTPGRASFHAWTGELPGMAGDLFHAWQVTRSLRTSLPSTLEHVSSTRGRSAFHAWRSVPETRHAVGHRLERSVSITWKVAGHHLEGPWSSPGWRGRVPPNVRERENEYQQPDVITKRDAAPRIPPSEERPEPT
jgi:hypothetical protein